MKIDMGNLGRYKMTPEEFFYLRKSEPKSSEATASLRKLKSGNKTTISICNSEIVKELNSLAGKSRRTVTDYIRRLIEQAIAKQQTKFEYALRDEFSQIRAFVKINKQKSDKRPKKNKEKISKAVSEQIKNLKTCNKFISELRGRYLYNKKIQTIISANTVFEIYKNRPQELKLILQGKHQIYKIKGKKIEPAHRGKLMGEKKYYNRNLPDYGFGS